MPDAFDLLAYWSKFPPAHVTLAGIAKGLAGGETGSGSGSKGHVPSLEELHDLAASLKKNQGV